MTQNAVIDIAIALMLMYLVLSLLCTTINEYIATILSLRAKNLKSSIENLLDNPALREKFYQHGLINTSNDASGGHSSYFSGKTVAMALIGALDTSKPIPGFSDVQQAVTELPDNCAIKSTLLATITEAGGNMDKLRASIAGWYDDAMDRLSGVYKRDLKCISLVIGLAIAAAVNADTLRVGQALWNDPSLREQAVSIAAGYVKACGNAGCVNSPADLENIQKQFKSVDQTLRPLPVGWPESVPMNDHTTFFWWLIQKVGGLAITGFALSLGAPFWFDLLSKMMKLRGTGNKPERTDATR